jgi:ppGpp synthetase/RelA/SpoT-type nucleotidyltranferase
MAWAQPRFTKAEIDLAGTLIAGQRVDDIDAWMNAFEVVDNWRSAHAFPLNTFQLTLRKRARAVYPHALVAQRIKRFPSIVAKLNRFSTITLSKMQDLGGCRAIVDSPQSARHLRVMCLGSKRSKHEFVREKNYIDFPKESGYRGIHLIYRFHSEQHPEYNGLQVEMQLRSHIQHAWATAVETVGTFLEQPLKSSEGPENWLRFFRIISSAFATLERTPLVPNTVTRERDLKALARTLASDLDVVNRLTAYGAALRMTGQPARKGSHYFLLSLNPTASALSVKSYGLTDLEQAVDDYARAEKAMQDIPGAQAVLVKAGSVDSLRRAYPNFYLDTNRFLRYMQIAIR